MDTIHTEYYKNAFNVEIKAIRERFEEILALAGDDKVKLNELTRNFKAAQWLHKTYINNIELYEAGKPCGDN